MPRRPTRPILASSLAWPGPPGSLAWALFGGPAKTLKAQVSRLDPDTYVKIITVLLWSNPRKRRLLFQRRLRALIAEYQMFGPTSPPELGIIRAIKRLAGLSDRVRCHPQVLLQHKAMALQHLEQLPPVGRSLANRALVLRDKLRPLFTALATVPCPCGHRRQGMPELGVLREWPRPLGGLTVSVLAWHHDKKPSTMRSQLARAGGQTRLSTRERDRERENKRIERRLLRLFKVQPTP
jgi:hypothetical protein